MPLGGAMATYRKRGKSWQAQVRRNGIVKAKTFRTKAMAEAWARQTEDELTAGHLVDTKDSDRILLRDLLEQYRNEITPRKRSSVNETNRINQLVGFLGDVPLCRLTPDRIVKHADDRLKTCTAETVRKDLGTLGHVLKVSQTLWGIRVKGDPVRQAKWILSATGGLEPSTHRDRRLLPGEEKKLKKELPICAKAAFLLAIDTGMRRGEIMRIRREDISSDTLHIPKGKVGARTIPLTKRAQRILSRLEGDELFQIQPDSITQAFERACRRAKITGLTFHDLRHEAASRFFERGLSIPEVALITGHKTWESLKRYTNLKPTDLVGKIQDKPQRRQNQQHDDPSPDKSEPETDPH